MSCSAGQIRLTCSLLLLLIACLPLMPRTAAAEEALFPDILQKTDAQLASIGSEAEALAVFSSRLISLLRLADSKELASALSATAQSGTGAGRSSPVAADELSGAAVRLTGELAAWRLARLLKEAADGPDLPKLRTVLSLSESHKRWLLAGRDSLRQVLKLAEVLSEFGNHHKTDVLLSGLDPAYAAYLDRAYPRLTGPDSSWVALAEREGPGGILRRLYEFWGQTNPAGAGRAEPSDKEAQASLYIASRLLPVLSAQTVASAIRAESLAEQQVRAEWVKLQTWGEKRLEKKALARLCGTWQWVVHNHKNHQEHKMMMRFDPPEAPGSSQPRPTKIVVLGDSVYLRWEFQGGYQEDSLLFAGEGQRLEGTFVNSAGAWGSIAGKRVAPCAG